MPIARFYRIPPMQGGLESALALAMLFGARLNPHAGSSPPHFGRWLLQSRYLLS